MQAAERIVLVHLLVRRLNEVGSGSESSRLLILRVMRRAKGREERDCRLPALSRRSKGDLEPFK